MAKKIQWLAGTLVLACVAATAFANDEAAVQLPPAEEQGELAQEDRIAELERTVAVLANELERTRADLTVPEDPELISQYGFGPAASKIYGLERGLSIGGYGEIFYSNLISDKGDGKDRADALRTVLYVGYKFNENIVFNSEYEFEHATSSSTASSGNGSVSVEFATLDYLWKDWANFRAGLLLVPMGWINEIHESPYYLGTHRPEVERQIIPSTWRELGGGIFGTLFEDVTYSAYVINSLNGTAFNSGGLRGGRQKGNRALAENTAFVTRIDWSPLPELLVGGSVYYGKSGQNQEFDVSPGGALPDFMVEIPDTPTTIWEVHGQYANKGFFLRGLFTMAHLNDAGALSRALGPVDEGGIGNLGSGEGIGGQMLGVYGEIAYDLLPLFVGETEMSFEPFFRAEYYDTQRKMPSGYEKDLNKRRTILTAGVQYKPITNVVVKLDYRNRRASEGELSDELNMGVGFAF
jgi:opacity protein-like surface antigen